MVNQWTVLNRLKQTAPLDDEGAASGLPLCVVCLEEIRARLREGADGNDIRIERAAAGLAFYKTMLKRIAEDGGVTGFKAGDVSVRQNPGDILTIAEKVRDEALAGAAPLLRDDLFVFKRVGA